MLDALEPRSSVTTATTVCPFCGSGCCMLLEGSSAFPRLRHPVSQGALCLRGWSAGEITASPLRVTTAYTRDRGHHLGPARTEDVIDGVAAQLARIRREHGGASIGILGSARITVEETLALRRLAAALGTPHVDSLQRIGYLHFPPLGLDAVERARRLVVLGANLTVRQPQAGRRVLRALDRGAEVRFVHSRRVQLASLGARHDIALPGHELERLGSPGDDALVLLSSEIALSGQGAEAARLLRGTRTLFLTDYVNQRGAVEAGMHPTPGGFSAWEMLHAASDGRLRALLVFADDPFEFFPTLSAFAFARADLVVVTDAVKSASARHAGVVLPGALLAEKHGTVVNTEGRAQELAPAASAPTPWTEGAVAHALAEYFDHDAAPAPAPSLEPGPGGVLADTPDEAHPFLAALDTTLFWNSHALVASTVTAWREARSLFADFPPGCVTLNPDDARALGVSHSAVVTLTSTDGSVTLPARLHPRMLPGTVWIAMPCWERCGTRLGALAYDPALRIPVFRPRAVSITRPEGR
jgi:predicted molibdopterin-dependent oxidoreductase YjgC